MSDEKISLELLGARVLTLTAEVRDLQHRFTAMESRFTAMEVRLGAADQSLNAPMHAGGEEEHRQDFLADVPANPEEAMIGMRHLAARSRRLA